MKTKKVCLLLLHELYSENVLKFCFLANSLIAALKVQDISVLEMFQLFLSFLFDVLSTYYVNLSKMDLCRQFYMLPH